MTFLLAFPPALLAAALQFFGSLPNNIWVLGQILLFIGNAQFGGPMRVFRATYRRHAAQAAKNDMAGKKTRSR